MKVNKAGAPGSWGLHWFRRDLRLAGNPALRWSWGEHRGRVLGLFCFDAKFLARSDFSVDRFAFFLATLAALADELRAAGGDLLVLDQGPEQAFPALIEALDRHRIARPATLSFNRDYEPYARARDQAVSTLLQQKLGVRVWCERDHLLIEPDELAKPDGGPGADQPRYYQVYSAFARRWFQLLSTAKVQARLSAQREGLATFRSRARVGAAEVKRPFVLTWPALFGRHPPPPDHLRRFTEQNAARVRVPIPEAGSLAALARLRRFAARIDDYKEGRDRPGLDATSKMSIYFKNGSLTPAQAIAALELGDAGFGDASSRSAYLREIVWREFYYHLLWHRPDVETRAFLPGLRDLSWRNRQDWFEAWKAGRTGYPMVDAGMRQLAQTGWMHNRVRMIVASFLTKDLLIDWRWGERYFMDRLLDGDLAPNNGGWQWAASTGADPQPYFRVFNPTLQSQRFDPDGAYLRAYLPERRDDDRRAVHLPRAPIVDHATQKALALALYRRG
jgi:deoxyribodipyrimidine photo-lyase